MAGRIRRGEKSVLVADPYVRQPEDDEDDQCLEAAVMQGIKDFLSQIDHTRSIGTLTKKDLRLLAQAHITGWILEKQRIEWDKDQQPPSNDRILSALFAG